MPRRPIAAAAFATGISVALLGCTGGPATTAVSPAPAARPAQRSPAGSPASYPPRPVVLADARSCPITTGHPVPLTKPWRTSMAGFDSAFGNAKLWVGALWPQGVVFIAPDNLGPDGQLEMKFGWYRLTSGYLTITGRRLDAPAPPASGRTFGYGLSGFNASSVIFPTEGCWQVTGRVGRAALTFVTFVIRGHCNMYTVPMRCVADHAR